MKHVWLKDANAFSSKLVTLETYMQMRFGKNTLPCYNPICVRDNRNLLFFFSTSTNSLMAERKCPFFTFVKLLFTFPVVPNFDPDSQRRRWASSTGEQKLFLIVKCCFPSTFYILLVIIFKLHRADKVISFVQKSRNGLKEENSRDRIIFAKADCRLAVVKGMRARIDLRFFARVEISLLRMQLCSAYVMKLR